jgi:hypothetical protein
MSDEVKRLEKLKADIVEERRKLKDEKEKAAAKEMVTSVSIAINQSGLKIYTTDGRLINSISWAELNEMKEQVTNDNVLITESSASSQTRFRETFQTFLEFCNTLYLPPEVENIPEGIVNNNNVDPNTRAFLDMIIHYEKYFEKNTQWKVPITRFLKWMCYLFKEDALMRERIGWMVWWWIVKHGNKLVLWESQFDPKHWTPYSDSDIMRDVEGPILTKPLTDIEQNEVARINEERMKEGVTKHEKV